ncbi:MAG: hypothetical protein H6719_00205 [Sandaracinaceae bacterium]|nr:hypothetical protein [Sandaracinaceae bacterium]
MARKIEMHWVCSSCQHRNLGRHKECQNCGDPKDASEPWLMPSDTGAAPSVTDPKLLQQANAGPDWQCGYCGSHQKRLDGRCAQCGAAQGEGKRVPVGGATAQPGYAPTPRPAYAAPARGAASRGGSTVVKGLALAALTIVGLSCVSMVLIAALYDPPPPVIHKPVARAAAVVGLSWRRVVHVERYRVIQEAGFVEGRPVDAFDITSLGQAHHHDEQVLDHYETEHYTEQVPYEDTETYTEQESCGEDCTDLPESCSEVCTPDDNGFATCRDVCSGGGQSCTTRYCSVTRTRSVTRYRSEPRTRQVPVYRSEPRYAERFEWHVWRWGHERDVTATGDGTDPPHWPTDGELAPPAPLAEGEQERTTRDESYGATLRTDAGAEEHLTMPSLAAYERLQQQPRWYLGGDPGAPSLVKPVRSFGS